MFEFKFTITEEDYLRFNQYHFLHSREGKKSLFAYRCLIPVIAYSFAIVIFAATKDVRLFVVELILMTVLSAIWILISKKRLLNSIKRSIKNMKRNGKLPYSPENMLTFGDTEFTDTDSDVSSTYKYSAIDSVHVTPSDIYLYLNSVRAILMPLSIFSSIAEANNFIAFLSSRIDPSKFITK